LNFEVTKRKWILFIYLYNDVRAVLFWNCRAKTRVARFFLVHDTKTGKNEHKMYLMVMKYSKWPQNMSIFSNLRPTKIYPIWDFWFKNKPSGNNGDNRFLLSKQNEARSGGASEPEDGEVGGAAERGDARDGRRGQAAVQDLPGQEVVGAVQADPDVSKEFGNRFLGGDTVTILICMNRSFGQKSF
jgi:hypothetical protein